MAVKKSFSRISQTAFIALLQNATAFRVLGVGYAATRKIATPKIEPRLAAS